MKYLICPFIQVQDINGKPIAGAKIYVYEADTTTSVITYQNFDGGLNTDPVLTDELGNATIIVDRENLKKILVGKNGSMIKEIGIRARKDIEPLIGRNVYLELFVKVIPKWRDREKFLNEIGFKEFNFDKDV